MTETEYIIATNRVKVSIALSIMRDVLAGEKYGISKKDCQEIASRLSAAQDRLFALVEIDTDPEE